MMNIDAKSGWLVATVKRALLIALFGLANNALAMLPDSGWYWNPAESGRGFNIEIQNNMLFMAAFAYDVNGNAVWLTTGGAMSSDHTYSGALYQTSAGQCFGCGYQPPALTQVGTTTINFTSSKTASITINGSVVQVQREQFGIDLSNQATPLLGEWAMTAGSPSLPLYFGDRITLSFTGTTSALGLTAEGSRTGATNRLALGALTSGHWGMIVDSSTSYYTTYLFDFVGFNFIQGVAATYLKTENPSGYLDFVGSRIRSGAAAAGALAPGITKKAVDPAAADAADAARAQAGRARDKAVLDELLNVARTLQPMLR